MNTESILESIRKSMLFSNLDDRELLELLSEENVRIEEYTRGALIFEEHDCPQSLFVLLSGSVGVIRNTYAGKRILVNHIETPGEIFGEIYLFLQKERYNIYAKAITKTTLLELRNEIFHQKIKEEMSDSEAKLRENMLKVFAFKAYKVNAKAKILGYGSVRGKIAAYLFDRQTEKQATIVIPSRENLADYLGVTRPALSRELLRMQREGILDINKRKITIINQEAFEKYL